MKNFNSDSFLTSVDSTDYLGKGSFCSVRLCHHKELQNVAVKCVKPTNSTIKNKYTMQFEAETLFRFKHKNILQIYGLTQWKSYLGIVMEYATNGNLEDLVLLKVDKNLSWPTRLRFCSEIAQGLDYLHNHDPNNAYVHGNLELTKILLSENLTVKITGLNEVSFVEASDLTSTFSPSSIWYPKLYAPPEFLINTSITRTCSMDVYSYAMIGYEILTRQHVYSGVPKSIILELIKDSGLKPDMEPIRDIEKMLYKTNLDIFCLIRDIMIQSWATDPNSRPSINEVKTKLEAISATYPDDIEETKHLIKNPIENSSTKVVLSQFEYPFISPVASNKNQDNKVLIDNSVRLLFIN